jgi:uncharacterized protein YndB with AHSA1/START domain
MKVNLIAETSIIIDAAPSSVWKALTTPALIKKWLMGTNVITDWQKGSQIRYEGEYNGKKYYDKGVIKKIEPEKLLQTTYWSSAGGKEDKPENYNLVTYKLSQRVGKTKVELTQDNVLSEIEKEHVTENWKSVLKKMKEVIENQKSYA